MAKINEYRKWLQSLPKEAIAEQNKRQFEEQERQYKDFAKKFAKHKCYLCNQNLKYFDVTSPCLHWLLRNNKRIKKQNIEAVLEKNGYFQVAAYLRWIANFDKRLQNINNLQEEKNPKKLFEYTIKYKNLEWSMSCAKGDYEGHKDRKMGKSPHYHFQMKINDNIFIKYSEFHIKFSEKDLLKMHIELGDIPEMMHSFGEGVGMQEFFDKLSPEEIISSSKPTEDTENASLNTTYLFTAKEGKTIKGKDILKIINLRRKEGKSLWNYKDKLPDANVQAIVFPGEGVPKIAGRQGGRGTKSKNK